MAHCEDGRVVLWEGGLPGDRCEVEILKDKGRFLEAALVQILTPSPMRQPSVCAYSDTCGGCQWLEAPYGEQVTWKQSFVADSFQRIGNITALPPIHFVPSPQPLAYRNRILLRCHVSATGHIQTGFFSANSHALIPIARCQVASASINEIVGALSNMQLPTGNKKFRCQLQEITGENGHSLLALLEPIEKPYAWIEPLRTQLAAHPLVAWVGIQGERAPFYAFETLKIGTAFTLPGIFQQINSEQNKALRTQIEAHVARKKPRSLLDLYCGAGNLSLSFAKSGMQITGVEFNKDSIRAAQHTVEKQGWKSMTYIAQDALHYLQTQVQKPGHFEYLIVDPPRSGMKELLAPLLRLRIPSIAYVSCNPATCARDVGRLLEAYDIESIMAFDFFPQTYHVETLVFLSLRAT